MKKMKGVITAMTTPFDEHDQVDVKALEEQVEFLIQKGVNCLYPCGTTGEMFNMTPEERELCRALGQLPDEIVAAAKYYDPARMTRYAMEVAALYHKFYQNCRVKCEDSAVCAARAALCRATATVLENTLGMLKITAPEVM